MSGARAYLRAEAIATTLGVHVRTVRRWIADGTLPSVRVGDVIDELRRIHLTRTVA